MSLPVCLLVLALCGSSAAYPFNMSQEGSGSETELIFPTVRTTRVIPPSPTPPPSLTTTFIRLKDFVLSHVVDFLRDNLLLIIVVTSLLVVIVFIVCCASAMSHKRKLETYYPPRKYEPRRYVAQPARGAGPQQSEPGHVTTYLRTPSKDLVGEKEGKEPRPKPQEVQRVEEVEEVEEPKEEPKKKTKKEEEPKASTSAASNSPAPVCTCHLRKAK